MSAVVGIDFSSFAVDLVTLDESADHATWWRIPLRGGDALHRTRTLRDLMPRLSFYDDIYLVAIEKPFGPSRLAQSVLMRVQGAIAVSIPSRIPVWEVTPYEWKKPLGLKITEKPPLDGSCFPPMHYDSGLEPWPQDALDALGVALYARAASAAGVAAHLGGGAAAA